MKDDMTTNPKPNQPNKETSPLYWLYQWEEWHRRFKKELREEIRIELDDPNGTTNYKVVHKLKEILGE